MTESSQKCPTPRQRFVEAQKKQRYYFYKMDPNEILADLFDGHQRQAAEAWADLECSRRRAVMSNDYHGDEAHAACVASILKEVFGE